MEYVQEKWGVMNQPLPQTLGAVVSKVWSADTGGSRNNGITKNMKQN
jgi:hypothetical protein